MGHRRTVRYVPDKAVIAKRAHWCGAVGAQPDVAYVAVVELGVSESNRHRDQPVSGRGTPAYFGNKRCEYELDADEPIVQQQWL